MSSSVAEEPLSRQSSLPLTVGILVAVFAVAFQSYAVATAMPQAAEELGHLNLYAWASSLFVIGMAISTVLGGRAVDTFGPVRPAALGLMLFTCGLIAAALAPSMIVLVLTRLMQGLGGGVINIALMVIVARAFEEHRRATVMSMFSFCWVLPAFIGPWITAKIVLAWSWPAAFWLLVPFMALTFVLCLRPLLAMDRQPRPQHTPERAPVPVWSAMVVAAGLAAVQAGAQRADLLGAGLAVVGLVALGISIPRLMAPGFFRLGAGIAAVSWTRMLQAGAFFAAETFLPLSLVMSRGASLDKAGALLTYGAIGWTLGSWLQARAWFRLRRDQIIAVGAGCGVLGLLVVAVGTTIAHWPGLTLIIIGYAIAGLGMGLSSASGSLAVMQLSAPEELGRNTSSLQVSEHVGNALTIGLAGALFVTLRTSHTPPTTFASLFALSVVVAALAVVTASRIGPVRNATLLAAQIK